MCLHRSIKTCFIQKIYIIREDITRKLWPIHVITKRKIAPSHSPKFPQDTNPSTRYIPLPLLTGVRDLPWSCITLAAPRSRSASQSSFNQHSEAFRITNFPSRKIESAGEGIKCRRKCELSVDEADKREYKSICLLLHYLKRILVYRSVISIMLLSKSEYDYGLTSIEREHYLISEKLTILSGLPISREIRQSFSNLCELKIGDDALPTQHLSFFSFHFLKNNGIKKHS